MRDTLTGQIRSLSEYNILITFFFVLALKERKIGETQRTSELHSSINRAASRRSALLRLRSAAFVTLWRYANHVIDCIVKSARVYW